MSTNSTPAAWSDDTFEGKKIDPDAQLASFVREPKPEAPRVFEHPIDVPALAKRVLAERSSWDRATRAAYYAEAKVAMATLATPEQQRVAWIRKLEMDCPECGETQQPAGSNCFVCWLPMLPTEWFDRRIKYPGKKMTPEQRAAAMARLAAGRATREANLAATGASAPRRKAAARKRGA